MTHNIADNEKNININLINTRKPAPLKALHSLSSEDAAVAYPSCIGVSMSCALCKRSAAFGYHSNCPFKLY